MQLLNFRLQVLFEVERRHFHHISLSLNMDGGEKVNAYGSGRSRDGLHFVD